MNEAMIKIITNRKNFPNAEKNSLSILFSVEMAVGYIRGE